MAQGIVIYVHPDYDNGEHTLTDINRMEERERLTWAKNSNFASVFALDTFALAFNMGQISENGFIFIQ